MSTKLLVIDDSEIALEWVKVHLGERGFEVLTYASPIGTQAALLHNDPDLVLLDVGMPGLKGDVLCKLIKENPRTQDTPVLLYSQRPEDELARLVRECNADGYIKKTNDVSLLLRQIEEALERAGSGDD